MHPLTKARRIAAISQTDLAKTSGVGRVTISRIESGEIRTPYPKTVRALADALGVEPLSLYESEPTEEEEVRVGK